MKKIFLLLAIASSFLFTGSVFANGISDYVRTPIGDNPYAPVNMTGIGNFNYGYGAIWLKDGSNYVTKSECIASGVPFSLNFNTPLNVSLHPVFVEYGDPLCAASFGVFEFTLDTFTMIEPPPAAAIHWGQIEPAQVTQALENTNNIFYDLWAFIALLIGLPLGFYLIFKIMKISPKDKK
jgi:hypothetical protein